jgi:diguanylate cyclase (GGDEF)-like protein/PAS domain S-box-containing protein
LTARLSLSVAETCLSSVAKDELGDLSRQFDAMTEALVETGSQLRRSEKQLREITHNLPVMIAYIDRDERFAFVNRTFKEWFGIEPNAVLGRKVGEVTAPELYEQSREYLQRALSGERVDFELDSDTLGVTRSLQNAYIPDVQADGSVGGIYALATDVSALKSVERQLRLLVRFDDLTRLANRSQFNEVLPLALARSGRSGLATVLMYLDVDHFKSINDTLGHAAGDAVLCEFAHRLLRCVRSTDTVARLAGDEFVIIIEGLHSDAETQFVARKIIARVNLPFDIDGRRLDVTASVGIAYHDSTGGAMDATQLLDQADQALYAAKKAGRNTFRIVNKPVSLILSRQ